MDCTHSLRICIKYCSRLVRDRMSWTKFVRSKLHAMSPSCKLPLMTERIPIETIGSEDTSLFRDQLVGGGVSHAEAKLVDVVGNAL